LLEQNGFGDVLFYPSLIGIEDVHTRNFLVIFARKELE
jgi:hypothetical protein